MKDISNNQKKGHSHLVAILLSVGATGAAGFGLFKALKYRQAQIESADAASLAKAQAADAAAQAAANADTLADRTAAVLAGDRGINPPPTPSAGSTATAQTAATAGADLAAAQTPLTLVTVGTPDILLQQNPAALGGYFG